MHGSLARAGLGRVSAALFFVLAGSLCMVSRGRHAFGAFPRRFRVLTILLQAVIGKWA